MTQSLCKTAVLRVYQEVIEDVISGVRDLFIEDGVDEQVLQELKHTWETKLTASKAVQNEEEKLKKTEITTTNGFQKQVVTPVVQHVPVVQQQQAAPPQQQQVVQPAPQQQQQVVVDTKMVPIQITLPPQPGTDGGHRVLTIQVPATSLQNNQLQKVLTGPVITATMGLPANIASSLLQQHVNAAFSSQQQSVAIVKQNIVQTDGAGDTESDDDQIEIEFIFPKPKKDKTLKKASKKEKASAQAQCSTSQKLRQCDGPMDTSDEDDDASEDDADDDDDLDDDKDDEHDMEDDGGEEEPLNSEDDVTDDDPVDLFDTDNIVVCQYDKIIRNRNKWKFYLKDGIMNLSGQDYVFQKANGDAEW